MLGLSDFNSVPIGLGVSVHVLACHGVAEFGSAEQRDRWLPDLLGGSTLGAFCLSESHAGSDVAAMRTRAVREGEEYRIDGTKAWITHGPVADFYLLMALTGTGTRGISAFHVAGGSQGISAAVPERRG